MVNRRITQLQSSNITLFWTWKYKKSLIFKNETTGEIEEVPPSALSEVFKVLGNKIDLVFLNACYSEKQARAIAKHVNCVIGMSDAIPDITAIEFASTFYSSLGFGKSIKTHLICNSSIRIIVNTRK